MGSMVTRDEALHRAAQAHAHAHGLGRRRQRCRGGAALAAQPARCATRRTTRRRAHSRAGCRPRAEIAQVLHPAFEGSPGHEHWRALCGADGLAAGLFSVVFDERYSHGAGRSLLRRAEAVQARLFVGRPGEPGGALRHRAMRGAAASWPHKGMLVRFSVGLEDVEDLRADLEQALGHGVAERLPRGPRRLSLTLGPHRPRWDGKRVATPNYGYEKRQKELAKKRKKEDKLQGQGRSQGGRRRRRRRFDRRTLSGDSAPQSGAAAAALTVRRSPASRISRATRPSPRPTGPAGAMASRLPYPPEVALDRRCVARVVVLHQQLAHHVLDLARRAPAPASLDHRASAQLHQRVEPPAEQLGSRTKKS